MPPSKRCIMASLRCINSILFGPPRKLRGESDLLVLFGNNSEEKDNVSEEDGKVYCGIHPHRRLPFCGCAEGAGVGGKGEGRASGSGVAGHEESPTGAAVAAPQRQETQRT